MYEELQKVFNKLAENASKFLFVASTQRNESFNNSICSKSSKRLSFSKSKSCDYRLAATVGHKNYVEGYIACIYKLLGLQANLMILTNFIQTSYLSAGKRKKKSREFKK